MSKIAADNLRAPTAGVEAPTRYAVQGSAKAWARFNGTGTVAINDSLNLSSLTDNGAGDYTLNKTTAFTNANYAFLLGTGSTSSATGWGMPVARDLSAAPTASAFRYGVLNLSTWDDTARLSYGAMGALA
jgi:hypothetical protein